MHCAPVEMRGMVSVFNYLAEEFMRREDQMEEDVLQAQERWTPPCGMA